MPLPTSHVPRQSVLAFTGNATSRLEHKAGSRRPQTVRTEQNKLINHRFHYDLRKYYFSARIVNIWNNLPNRVVDVNSVNVFKARLDRFWMDQYVKFDFTADLTGTGDRSVNVISET